MNTTNQQEERYYAPPSTSPVKAWLMLLASIIIIGFFVAVFILARTMLQALSPLFVLVFMGVVLLAMVGAVVMGIYHWYSHVDNKRQQAHLVRPNQNNAYAAMWIEAEKRFVQPVNGQLPTVVPSHYSPSIHNQNDVKELYKIIELAQQQRPLEIEGPGEQIAPVIRYEEVEHEIPEGMSLLGIHPDGALELSSWEKLKMLWIIGSSSTGKSNTVFGMAQQARKHGVRFLIVDQHAIKTDSLARKLAPFETSFLRPIAVTDDQVLAVIRDFKAEFERRVAGASCELKIVLIMDEINRMARNEALLAAIKEIVAIGGEESRGFNMFVWAISQKAVYLKWLRDSAITVIAHRLTRMEEALLACNEDRKAAARLLKFQVGRCFVYGVDFDDLIELQQPLYRVPVIESTVQSIPESTAQSDTDAIESITSASGPYTTPVVEPMDRTLPFDMGKFRQAQKMLLARETQNKIICEVWSVQENTRQFRAAKEEFQLMLAYLASMASVEEE